MPVLALLLGTVCGWATGVQTVEGVSDSFAAWGGIDFRFTLWSNITNLPEMVD